jgi:hypothetical protein
MKTSLDSVVLAVNLFLLGSRALPAQPLIRGSIDAAIARTSVRGGEYLDGERGKLATAGGAYIDLGLPRTPLQLVLGITGERYYNGDAVNAICVPGSHGQCLTRVPNLGGLLGLVGLRYEPVTAVSALAAFGYGDLGSPGEGDRGPTNARADEIRLEVRLRVLSRLAIGARYQYTTVPNYTGIRFTARPVSLVLSFQ